RGQRLTQIPGMTPSLLNLPEGCAFRTRCPYADPACMTSPDMTNLTGARGVRCFHPLLVEAAE
ncbi:MAG: oligopeptide/dipeptide ABC transporter ATP-binding protein, partial [Hyphomicrobiaceae bacterium]